MIDGEAIDRLATNVADRTKVDWDAVSVSATTDGERSVIRYLKWIDQIAAFSESMGSAGASSSLPSMGEAGLGTWGQLRLLERTGEGAFGEVYRAWDPRLDREVALKLLRPRQSAEGAESRLVDEARLLARVHHPNVVAIYGADEIEGRVGFWMEFIRGKTLERVLHDVGPLGAHEATLIGLDLCRALAAIHAVGLLHRDIKTSNIMREDGGRLVLMDLGAGRLAVTDPMNMATDLTGTPAYLAPEIAHGGPASMQSDLYSVGVVLYRLVTRAYPIAATSLTSLQLAHASGRRTRLLDVRADLPSAFVRVVECALAESPSDRYGSDGELEADLAAALTATASPSAKAESQAKRARFTRARQAALAGAMVAVAIGLGALFDVGGLRTRLTGGLGTSLPSGPVRLPQQVMGRPSRNGRYLPYLDRSGHVVVWDALTAHSRRVDDHEPGKPAPFATMSPAGDRVAYGWRLPEPDSAWELRVQDLDKPSSRAILPRETAFTPIPVDWSRDGRFVLCWFSQRDHTVDLALVPTDGGSPRVLHTYSRQPVAQVSLSPDGRFVTVPDDPDEPKIGLTIVSTDGSGHKEVTTIQASDARWAPDGLHLILLRLDANPSQIWQVAIVDGRPTGPVQPVYLLPPQPHAGDWTSLYAMTDQAVVMLEQNKRLVDSYTAPIDRGFDHIPGPPTRVSPTRVGDHVGPSWSPDGRSLAYLDVSGTGPRQIIVKDSATGVERIVPATLPFIGGQMPQWTPDGQFVIVYARDADDQARNGLYRIAVSSGAANPVVILGPPRQMATSPTFQCTKNPSALLYIDGKRGLVAHDLNTDRERVLVDWQPTNRILMFRVAFDGQTIALQRERGVDKERVETLEVRAPDGTIHAILERPPAKRAALAAWTPAGDIVFEERTLAPDTSNVVNHLWTIAATGGAPHDVGFAVEFAGQNLVTVRPDGQQFAYTEDKLDCELLALPHLFPQRR